MMGVEASLATMVGADLLRRSARVLLDDNYMCATVSVSERMSKSINRYLTALPSLRYLGPEVDVDLHVSRVAGERSR